MSKENSNVLAVVETVAVIVIIDGENYSVNLAPADAEKYEKIRSVGAKTAVEKDFIFGIKSKALKSAIAELKSSVKVENAKRSKVTRAEVVAEVLADYPELTENKAIADKVAEVGKRYGLIPNDDEVLKYNLPKVRAAFSVIRSRYNLVLKAVNEIK